MKSSTGILSIDLSAIQSNWRLVSQRLSIGTECAAVVKADAYGVGAESVAKALYKIGCRHFYLATLDEALVLRYALPSDAVLYVLAGVKPGSEFLFAQHQLLPVLYSTAAISQWLSFCGQEKTAFPCVIKVDTGMTRLGLSKSDLFHCFTSLPSPLWFNPVLLMSHLACADEPVHPLNQIQLEAFHAAIALVKQFFPQIKCSLANSSGSFLGSDFHFDMVRIGAALYGINPQPLQENPLCNVLTLRLPVLQQRLLDRMALIGYGATAEASVGQRLAVVAGGYADGLHRTLGFAPVGEVNGSLVKAIGRISMDSMVFDLSGIEGNIEFVEVLNHTLTLDILMRSQPTLGYEVLTSLGRRFHRDYSGGGANGS